ncbi:MAG TPA: hypothetical protein VIO57_15820 [Chloroflexota bacterium]|jgi:hypothetical protein
MPNVDLTEMDLAVVECLHRMMLEHEADVQPPSLVPCLERQFPGNDEAVMREGESITRLRGRQLLEVDADGRLSLTPSGLSMAEGLQMERR